MNQEWSIRLVASSKSSSYFGIIRSVAQHTLCHNWIMACWHFGQEVPHEQFIPQDIMGFGRWQSKTFDGHSIRLIGCGEFNLQVVLQFEKLPSECMGFPFFGDNLMGMDLKKLSIEIKTPTHTSKPCGFSDV
ncbi:hypothetical protein JCM33374_g5601 [Metschnikowia sp. JCM 33374]|nr:hypothetical protein JCM33374_g5601 [Metschnikowia sp. JCM 33374]